jgi:SAM-dependent methyltransferase
MNNKFQCRFCNSETTENFLDLGFAPHSNAYRTKADLIRSEIYYPLKLVACKNCWLVQTIDYSKPEELFQKDYAYYSSTSTTWLKHAKDYTELITNKLKLDNNSFVVEVASNDGYLLKNFLNKKIPCLGVEPTKSTADIAKDKGIPVIVDFFNTDLAKKIIKNKGKADLIIGNNVFAHVPDVNSFTKGLKILLKNEGVITLEFPHLSNILDKLQFDTVYHEHYSYFSLSVVMSIFAKANLRVYDVEVLNTHGGSLRIYACHKTDKRKQSKQIKNLLKLEKNSGVRNISIMRSFQSKIDKIKNNFIKFLLEQKNNNKIVIGYGAAAKGSTLLNYSGVRADLIQCICDLAKSKIGKFTPGTHIPILSPSEIRRIKPDIVIIFPWNISKEVQEQLKYIRNWGGKFVTVVPDIKIT